MYTHFYTRGKAHVETVPDDTLHERLLQTSRLLGPHHIVALITDQAAYCGVTSETKNAWVIEEDFLRGHPEFEDVPACGECMREFMRKGVVKSKQ